MDGSFLDIISAGLGHPVDRVGAGAKGALLGAQTDSALSQARERRAKAVQEERIAARRQQIEDNPESVGGTFMEAVLGAGYGNVQQAAAAGLDRQTQDFRTVVADPLADNAARYRNMEAASLKPVDQYYDPAPGLLADRNTGAAPTVNAVGDSTIRANDALAAQRNVKAGAGGAPLLRSSAGVTYQSLDGGGSWQPIADPAQLAQIVAQISGGRASGKIAGEAAATLSDTEADIDKLGSSVQGFLDDPGFDKVYGRTGTLANNGVGRFIAPEIASADARLKNIDAQTFGVAVAKMRGLGQLSNAEGMKVTDAFTRASNRSLHPEQAREAWAEVQAWLALAKQRAQRKAAQAGGGTHPAVPAALSRTGAATVGLSPEETAELAQLEAELGGQ